MDSRIADAVSPEEVAERIVLGIEREFVQKTADLLLERLRQCLDVEDIYAQFLMNRLRDTIGVDLYNLLLDYDKRITEEVDAIIREAASQTELEQVLQALTHAPSYAYTEGFQRLTDALVKNCAMVIRRDNVTLINNQQDLWYRVSNRAITQKLLQAKSTDKIIREAVDAMGRGITQITYDSGARISVDAGIRRHIVSQVGQAWNVMNETRAEEYNWDLFMCSAHAMSRPEHYPHQGHIFSKGLHIGEMIDGQIVRDYAELEIGEVTGIYGANCAHFMTVYVPNASKLQTPPYDEAENKRRYDASQKQRAMERNIRKTKTDIKVAEGINASTTELRMKLRNQQKRVREYCMTNDLVRRYDLEISYL